MDSKKILAIEHEKKIQDFINKSNTELGINFMRDGNHLYLNRKYVHLDWLREWNNRSPIKLIYKGNFGLHKFEIEG